MNVFNFRTLKEIKDKVRKLGINLPFSNDIKILKNPVVLNGLSFPNRLVVHPMEGYDANKDGSPSELTYRRYNRFGSGGAGIIWFEATSVSSSARSNPHQLWINENNLRYFEKLVNETRISGKNIFGKNFNQILILQINHSGRYSKPGSIQNPIITHHSEVLDSSLNIPYDYPLVTDDELEQLQEEYIKSIKLACKAGFDGVDLKSCHGYLISELLASFTRKGKYGGSFENRTRFLLEVIKKTRIEVPRIKIFVRLNMYDGIKYPYGFGVDKSDSHKVDLYEPIRLIGELKKLKISGVSITAGNPYFNSFMVRPADNQIFHEHPLNGIARFVDIAFEIRKVYPDIFIIGGGYSWLREFFPYLAASLIKNRYISVAGLGRGALAYPDFAKDIIIDGVMKKSKVCITCSKCTELMRKSKNIGCVIRDTEIYSKIYQEIK